MLQWALTQRPHGGVRWSLPAGVSETRPTTNQMNLPPRTHKHTVWLARACTGIWFDWLTLPSKLQKLNIAQLLKRATRAKRRDGTTMQFGKAWRHRIQSEWAEVLKLQRTPPCGRAATAVILVFPARLSTLAFQGVLLSESSCSMLVLPCLMEDNYHVLSITFHTVSSLTFKWNKV